MTALRKSWSARGIANDSRDQVPPTVMKSIIFDSLTLFNQSNQKVSGRFIPPTLSHYHVTCVGGNILVTHLADYAKVSPLSGKNIMNLASILKKQLTH